MINVLVSPLSVMIVSVSCFFFYYTQSCSIYCHLNFSDLIVVPSLNQQKPYLTEQRRNYEIICKLI